MRESWPEGLTDPKKSKYQCQCSYCRYVKPQPGYFYWQYEAGWFLGCRKCYLMQTRQTVNE
jgi:hypothetical protein